MRIPGAGVRGGGRAERVYLNEDGISLDMLAADVARMRADSATGQDLWLALRNEDASGLYPLDLLTAMFETDARGAFSVRGDAIGHSQQGGVPTPFDRINSVRLASGSMQWLDAELDSGGTAHVFATPEGTRPWVELVPQVDFEAGRLVDQWWEVLRPVLDALGRRPPTASD